MNQMVIGATLQGKPAWFMIENKYDSPGKWKITTSEDNRRPVVYNQDQLNVLIEALEKICRRVVLMVACRSPKPKMGVRLTPCLFGNVRESMG